MSDTVSIPLRFNGPLDSGNGGYCSGVVAALIDGPAEVRLRRPVPLDTPLEVVRDAGGFVRLLDGEQPVIEGRPVPELELVVPAPVSVSEARAASARYAAPLDSIFSHCFVCGRARDDAFGVFAGPVEGRDLVASPWTAAEWTADGSGNVQPEFVWAALDCPTYFALYGGGELQMSFLGTFSARIDRPVPAGREHVVIGWPIAFDSRKHHAGSAVLSADGEVLAVARALLIGPAES